ncbi:DUF488 domain-containing protein [Candidatus Pacearchaeota archaeon]|nr:DUF488 domain-containing protein [Candidatus Pacearchaeota archaeon]
MKIFTSHHAKIEQLFEMGLTPISISVMFPRYSKIKYPEYKKLAPRYDMLKMDWQTYNIQFQKILKAPDPVRVYAHLSELSRGKDIVLLCYEKDRNECHRQMVAEWLEKKLQINVKEVIFQNVVKKEKPKSVSNQTKLF